MANVATVPSKDPLSAIRPEVAALEPMKIAAIAEFGQARGGVIPLWYGESDLPTPSFIRAAAAASLDAGETFYAPQAGLPALRQALADYSSRLNRRPVAMDRITVTASGMTGLHIALQTICRPGDNVVVVVPVWPNIAAAATLMGAEVRRVSLTAGPDGSWSLDLDRLFATCDGRTRAIVVNSPNNPTGWVCPAVQQQAIFEWARARGVWIVADEVYDRISYDAPRTPSFLELASPDDHVIAVNSFSKSWAMTGFRLGWLTAPAALATTLGTMVQYTNSSSPTFVQKAGLAAVTQGENFIREFVAYCREGRDLTCDILGSSDRIRIARPVGAFYGFFRVEGCTDSMQLAKDLVTEAGVGVAPGAAFGDEGEGWMRLCFAQASERLETSLTRILEFVVRL